MDLDFVCRGDLFTVYRFVDDEGAWALKVPTEHDEAFGPPRLTYLATITML